MLIVALAAGHSPAAFARAKEIERHKVSIDGQSFRVIRYDNGSVKVVDGGIFGDGVSYNLRERMRKAAKQGTGCELADDFWLDGKLIGTLRCPGEGAAS
ncbi:hypothetical protein H5V43_01440 [Sphingobium fuliginis]|jgi:hypothetical protein|uniref:Uncharacterized protein n=2 Tax=Sphingobium fuliginis (strain ATCC 27551) TaxID=336203 RepID=A0A7M2GGM6_SPHSA|nr:hypothetical protein [Sphingobium fuliginis]QOT71870.1 hypothetical protein H5V43_01440 [Sphingobium fuliginis]